MLMHKVDSVGNGLIRIESGYFGNVMARVFVRKEGESDPWSIGEEVDDIVVVIWLSVADWCLVPGHGGSLETTHGLKCCPHLYQIAQTDYI